jgi:hypothetical protein
MGGRNYIDIDAISTAELSRREKWMLLKKILKKEVYHDPSNIKDRHLDSGI